MLDPKIHRQVKLIPPPATRFSLQQDGLYLDFERNKTEAMIMWLEACKESIRYHVEFQDKMHGTHEDAPKIPLKEIRIGGVKVTLPEPKADE